MACAGNLWASLGLMVILFISIVAVSQRSLCLLYRFHSSLNRGRHRNETPTVVTMPAQLTLMWKRY
jgi:hypothetical protein